MEKSGRKIWIKTYGCQMNTRDSDTLKTLLKADGHTIVEKEEEADIALLYTCSIRDLAESKALGKAGRLIRNKRKNPNYRIGILGCMASRQGKNLLKKLPQLDWIIPPQNLSETPQLIRKTLDNNFENCLIPEIPQNFDFSCYEAASSVKPTLFVPVQQGCNMACSYCIVPQTRGVQQNRPLTSIIKEIEIAAQTGTKEITLLGQIVNTYQDPETQKRFPDLLEAVQAVEGIERIRFISPHPAFFTDTLIECFEKLPKLCPAIHLPVQSGSNRLLKEMHRAYTREKIYTIVDKLRAINPLMSISTDIIVGYPGESETDFNDTCDLFDHIQFDMAYIFKYSPRPATLAAPQQKTILGIEESVKEERNQILLQKLNKYSTAYNKQFLNTQQSVLIEGKAHRGIDKLFGRNLYNKKVIIKGPETWIGTLQNVQITQTSSSVLEGTTRN